MVEKQENIHVFTGLVPKLIFTSYIVESILMHQRYLSFLQLWLLVLSDNNTASVIPVLYHPHAMEYIYNGS